MISKLKPKRGEAGFTLLEILVAVVIIGILFALAAPVYAEQVKNGLKTSVTNDVKNVSGEMDNSWNEDEGYPLCFNQKLSDGNTANYYVNGVLVCSQAADADSPTTTGSTPSSTTGGGGTYTGGTGTGNSNGTGGTGSGNDTNTDPSSTGSSGGSFAGQYVGSYFGEYCVEVTNKDLNKENGAGWQHYSSEDMKLKPGRCTT